MSEIVIEVLCRDYFYISLTFKKYPCDLFYHGN